MKTSQRRVSVLALLGACLAPSIAAAQKPVIDAPQTARFGAIDISMHLATAMGLSCNLIGFQASCHRSEVEAREAAIESDVVAAACAPMVLYGPTGATGSPSYNIYSQSAWINLPSSFNNITSSWRAGCVGGYLADGTGGAGTRVGGPANHVATSLGTFDNKATSVLRCPC